jgi:uncharacterized protein (DUF983 family)
MMDVDLLISALKCKCPRCRKGNLYRSALDLNVNDSCASCGLDFTKNDSADGPAVFLIFILGFLLVPIAIAFEFAFNPPLWVHAVLWSIVAVGLTMGMLKPLKSYIIALQFKHRPGDWE